MSDISYLTMVARDGAMQLILVDGDTSTVLAAVAIKDKDTPARLVRIGDETQFIYDDKVVWRRGRI